jgi:hypothetical protein
MIAARVMRGAISLSIPSHLPMMLASIFNRPVRLRPGRAKLSMNREPIGSETPRNTIGTSRVSRCNAAAIGVASPTTTSDCKASNCELLRLIGATGGCEAMLDLNIAAAHPSIPFELPPESQEPCLYLGIVLCDARQHADPPHSVALLRPRRHRPRRRASEPRDELPAPHSITSSAVASSVGGTSMPRVLAVCRLMMNSNLVDCTTGKSAGFAPLRMRAT